jgi:peroxiredoxin
VSESFDDIQIRLKVRIKYLIIILIFLLIANLFFLSKNYFLKKQTKENFDITRKHYLVINSAPNFVLNDLDGFRYSSEEILRNSPHTLLIFFSPLDCRPCMEEMNLWQRIWEEGKVQVVGVAWHVDKRELKNWVENSEIIFPVLYDVESQVTKMFKINKTPLKILIDSNGKILLADKVRVNPEEQIEFIEKLDEIIMR